MAKWQRSISHQQYNENMASGQRESGERNNRGNGGGVANGAEINERKYGG
jgi:hypothetical protein